MYEDTTANVIRPDGETETFIILADVLLQGYTLALYLFVIVIDYVMKTSLIRREFKQVPIYGHIYNRGVPSITVADIDIADNIALVGEGNKEA